MFLHNIWVFVIDEFCRFNYDRGERSRNSTICQIGHNWPGLLDPLNIIATQRPSVNVITDY